MIVKGISTSNGIAIAPIYTYVQEEIVLPEGIISEEAREEALTHFESSLAVTIEQLQSIRAHVATALSEKEAAIFDAHIQIAQDPTWIDTIRQGIGTGTPAAKSTHDAMHMFASIFTQMDDPYMKERGADILDIGDRLIRNILGMRPRGLSHLKEEVILVAEDLTPSDTALLNPKYVKGFITAVGGPTSHAAIMARTLEIPALMGVGDLAPFKEGVEAILEGSEGYVVLEPTAEEVQKAEAKRESYIKRAQALKEEVHLEAVTKDGHRVLLFGNIGKANHAKRARELGAEGIGLFRTEFLYMEKDALPSEEEQFEAYKEAAELMAPYPVIIRTLDIGGDKELPALQLEKEMNPFLGYRALRICLDRTDMFKTQLRALLRASHYGDVHVMYPMVQGISEVREARVILEEAKAELTAEGIPFNPNMPIGIMVEIPSVAVASDLFIKEVDFFSIGTNDLIQYSMAADRGNERVSYLYQPYNPSILRLIKNIIDASHKEGKWTGMCGEMAGDQIAVPLLLGLGLDEFSMSATSILKTRSLIKKLDSKEMKELADKAVSDCETVDEVVSLVKEFTK